MQAVRDVRATQVKHDVSPLGPYPVLDARPPAVDARPPVLGLDAPDAEAERVAARDAMQRAADAITAAAATRASVLGLDAADTADWDLTQNHVLRRSTPPG